MPSRITKFTDRALKEFYANVLLHYKELKKTTSNSQDLWQQMFTDVQYALESPHGSLYCLDRKEKTKVYAAFDAIFYALPEMKSPAQRKKFNPVRPAFNPQTVFIIRDRYNDPIMDWLLIRAVFSDCSFHNHAHGGIGGWGASGRTHGHKSGNNDSSDAAAALAALAILAVAAAAAAVAAVALYYMLNEFMDGMERFYYGEGWLKAAFMMATSVVSGLGTTLLSFQFLSPTLISLAVTAGFNPATVVIGITFCVAAVGAGLGALAMDLLYSAATRNEDSMDPKDSLRFNLSEADEKHLEASDIDPIKVRCAMVALRLKIADTLDQGKKDKTGNNTAVPYFLHRMFGDNDNVQKLLQQVRDLKRGKITVLDLGDMRFDCKKSAVYTAVQATTALGSGSYPGAPVPHAAAAASAHVYEPYVPGMHPEPSAPPSYEEATYGAPRQ